MKYSQEIAKAARRNGRGSAGFSLVELLVVLAIIAILAALGGPSMVSIFRGSSLSQGGQMIQDQLTLFRQLAVNNNYVVEARIYNFKDSSRPGDGSTTTTMDTPGHYRGIQAFKVTPQVPQNINASGQVVFNKTAITKALRLPSSVIIDAGVSNLNTSNISWLIAYLSTPGGNASTTFYPTYNLGPTPGVAPQVPVTGDPPIFNVGTAYTYVAFQFNPDGSTNLPYTGLGTANCYMTLHAFNKDTDDRITKANLPTVYHNYYTIQIDPNNGRVYSYRP